MEKPVTDPPKKDAPHAAPRIPTQRQRPQRADGDLRQRPATITRLGGLVKLKVR